MPYIIGIALLIITIIIVGLILRKRIYDAVDKKEMWKMDIMNRDTAAQLSRVKSLNLTGNTQEKFEAWKARWDSIVTGVLPGVEELLFDAEDAADRYRFKKAKEILFKIDDMLSDTETEIASILAELNELLDSEKEGRSEIEKLQPKVKELKKNLIQNGYQYGPALSTFDSEVETIETSMKKFETMVESGDYMGASELVVEIEEVLSLLSQRIEEFPELYKTVKNTLPAQIKELELGIDKMQEDDYRIKNLGVIKEVNAYKKRLDDCMELLKNGSSKEVKTIIDETEERIKEIYDLLEKEVLARSFIETKMPGFTEQLEAFATEFSLTKEEVDLLKPVYYFEDGDLEKFMSIDKGINHLIKVKEEIDVDLAEDEVSHTLIRSNLETAFIEIQQLEEKAKEFKEFIFNLRKDELKAKEYLEMMRRQINDVQRKLMKSNIPGVPNFIWSLLESAVEKNEKVLKALDRKPLDISVVRSTLDEAKEAIKTVDEQTDTVIEQAYLTEQVIQYANRYRRQSALLEEQLNESERLFRTFDYELSLEKAATALEEVEPGALRKLEAKQVN